MNIEKVINVSKIYPSGNLALNDINLYVKEHEILALIGPNGAGKTTLLKIMALLDRPTSGEVYFKDQLVTDKNIEKLRLNITMVFQKPIFFNTSVYKNVAYGLKVRGYSKQDIERKVKNGLKNVGLDGFENRHINSLSGGEQQRVALARAIVLEPELLLLDEPLANVDPVNSKILEDIISNLKKETTIVLTTHNLSHAARLADRIAFVSRGKITQSGDAIDILSNPINLSIARFIGYENIFDGYSKLTEDGYALINVGNINIEAISNKEGKCHIAIRPEDITLFKKKVSTSARNVFQGVISEVKEIGPFIYLQINVNGTKFKVKITKRSYSEMQLKIGARVFLSFKASAVKVF